MTIIFVVCIFITLILLDFVLEDIRVCLKYPCYECKCIKVRGNDLYVEYALDGMSYFTTIHNAVRKRYTYYNYAVYFNNKGEAHLINIHGSNLTLLCYSTSIAFLSFSSLMNMQLHFLFMLGIVLLVTTCCRNQIRYYAADTAVLLDTPVAVTRNRIFKSIYYKDYYYKAWFIPLHLMTLFCLVSLSISNYMGHCDTGMLASFPYTIYPASIQHFIVSMLSNEPVTFNMLVDVIASLNVGFLWVIYVEVWLPWKYLWYKRDFSLYTCVTDSDNKL